MPVLFQMLDANVLILGPHGVPRVKLQRENAFAKASRVIVHAVHDEFAVHIMLQMVTLADDDQLYLITDGFQKQFGSIRNKKFSFKRIRELLEKIKVESMPLQKKYFENAWSNWSEGHEQTDDITIIGLKKYQPRNE